MCDSLSATLRAARKLDDRLCAALEHKLQCPECVDSQELSQLIATLVAQRYHLDSLRQHAYAEA